MTGNVACIPCEAEGEGDVTVYVTDACGCVDTDTAHYTCSAAKLDIKPGSCPNSFNRGNHGVLPVAVVGTAAFDVTNVDLASLRLSRADGIGGSVAPLHGPPGPHPVFEDVATPFEGELCDCHEATGDGTTDLSLKFDVDELVSALELESLSPGALVELCVSGTTKDGTEFHACDCVRLVPPRLQRGGGRSP